MECADGGGPRDRSRVNLEDSGDVRYWCGELKCDEQALRVAVDRVGVMVRSPVSKRVVGESGQRASPKR